MLRRVAHIQVLLPLDEDSTLVPSSMRSGGKSKPRSTRASRRFSPYASGVSAAQPTLGLSGPLEGMLLSGPISSRTRAGRLGFASRHSVVSERKELDSLIGLIASGPPSHRERPASLAKDLTSQQQAATKLTASAAASSSAAASASAAGSSSRSDSQTGSLSDRRRSGKAPAGADPAAAIAQEDSAKRPPADFKFLASSESTSYKFLQSTGYGANSVEPQGLHPRAKERVEQIRKAERSARAKRKALPLVQPSLQRRVEMAPPAQLTQRAGASEPAVGEDSRISKSTATAAPASAPRVGASHASRAMNTALPIQAQGKSMAGDSSKSARSDRSKRSERSSYSKSERVQGARIGHRG